MATWVRLTFFHYGFHRSISALVGPHPASLFSSSQLWIKAERGSIQWNLRAGEFLPHGWDWQTIADIGRLDHDKHGTTIEALASLHGVTATTPASLASIIIRVFIYLSPGKGKRLNTGYI